MSESPINNNNNSLNHQILLFSLKNITKTILKNNDNLNKIITILINNENDSLINDINCNNNLDDNLDNNLNKENEDNILEKKWKL